ncbi:hypothetical protein O181_032716 [Austropuccinia psidii MF-1]|uniref:Uncharacterized protein n=1 Tax=Austropuccinia psidii MF-1 TaxID=1389203 RepID=A0A9Q3H6E2_9BASI|nr:hypothetical protein [Austropuccinia psidii MF-1]
MEGAAPFRRGGGLEEDQGEQSGETEVEAALAGAPKPSEAPNLAPSNKPLVSQAEQNFLKMMEKMTQFMGQLTQAVSPRDTSRAPEFKTPSIKEPHSFDDTKAYIMTQQASSLTGKRFCTQLPFSLLELENGLSLTS